LPKFRESLAVDWRQSDTRRAPLGRSIAEADVAASCELLRELERWFVLTGAGCSTDSGIPAYRDREGVWQHRKPMTYQAFTADLRARSRYWRRSMNGYPYVRSRQPNVGHRALAKLSESIARPRVELLVTQNVDGLHQKAGSRNVLELHGGLGEVICLR